MHLHTRNVNTAFHALVQLFEQGRIETNPDRPSRVMAEHLEADIVSRPSRNGPVLMIAEPVTITYTHPRERVLFNSARDANPFFHLYEALWMLAGRNDAGSLAYYNKRMMEFSDDGKTMNGAYGCRWRHSVVGSRQVKSSSLPSSEHDQLDILVNHLKADPNSRRAVLQMWNVEDDLLKIGGYGVRTRCTKCYGAGGPILEEGEPGPAERCDKCKGTCWINDLGSRDICCNLSVMFSLRDEPDGNRTGTGPERFLDMTVISRSEDLVWGLLGADYVDFSILQEYMAARLGAEVGVYHHFTNNLHAYENNWKPKEWLNDRQLDWYGKGIIREHGPITNAFPLVKDPVAFEKELSKFVDRHNMPKNWIGGGLQHYTEPFLIEVAEPMFAAFHHYKNGIRDVALSYAASIKADDWQIVTTNWLKKRIK